MNISKGLSKFIKEIRYVDYPEEAKNTAKTAITDCIGVMIGGIKTDVGQIILQYAQEFETQKVSTVIGEGIKTTPETAALINGTLSHAIDFDDINTSLIGHPSVNLVPSIFALGEYLNSSGEDIVLAYLTGFEVQAKLGKLFNPSHYEAGWHSTATLGTFGATAACSKLLDLSAEEIQMALGIAASLASGLRDNFGTMTKPLHAGRAAQNGILASSLARKKFTGNPNILQTEKGFTRMFNVDEEIPETGDFKLDSDFEIINSGVVIKKYPSCGCTHPSIDGVLKIVNKYDINYEDIEQISTEINPLATNVLIYNKPQTGLEGKFSMEYCLSVAAIDKKVGLKQFNDERVTDPEVQKFLDRVKVIPNMNFPFKYLSSTIEISLKNGQKFSETIETPIGSPETPMSKLELEEKFRDCVNDTLTDNQVSHSLKVLGELEQIENINILTNCLSKNYVNQAY